MSGAGLLSCSGSFAFAGKAALCLFANRYQVGGVTRCGALLQPDRMLQRQPPPPRQPPGSPRVAPPSRLAARPFVVELLPRRLGGVVPEPRLVFPVLLLSSRLLGVPPVLTCKALGVDPAIFELRLELARVRDGQLGIAPGDVSGGWMERADFLREEERRAVVHWAARCKSAALLTNVPPTVRGDALRGGAVVLPRRPVQHLG